MSELTEVNRVCIGVDVESAGIYDVGFLTFELTKQLAADVKSSLSGGVKVVQISALGSRWPERVEWRGVARDGLLKVYATRADGVALKCNAELIDYSYLERGAHGLAQLDDRAYVKDDTLYFGVESGERLYEDALLLDIEFLLGAADDAED